ncbi:UNKNOWN [Stylonychia lemnae]|uniref:Transmembrane protein n=1 Tax=Stylonychia lemnae TaxID=5949 RepID=A0A078B975_STYLE|nr:UNKNOWN [Stylonychia lemnae]|eukprot:CDW90118.1 UNKNOWN [Stylonychia lemnae]
MKQHVLKIVLLSILASLVSSQNQSTVVFSVRATYMPDFGILYYDRYDIYGRFIERLEYFYPLPPIGECNSNYTFGNLEQSLQTSSLIIPGNQMPSTQQVTCCDYYSPGRGYEFTKCENGLGIFILKDRQGTQRDLYYMSIGWNQVGINTANWTQLIELVDQYCLTNFPDQQLQTQPPPQFLSIPVPWQEWYNEWLQNPALFNWTIPDYRLWIENYQEFLNVTNTSISSVVVLPSNQTTTSGGRIRRMLQAAADNQTAAVTNETGAANQTNATATNETTAPGAANTTNATGAANETNATGASNQTNTTEGGAAANQTSNETTNETQPSNQTQNQTEITAIWLPEYDNFTVPELISNLTARGLYQPFIQWYFEFFGVNGQAVKFFSQSNSTTSLRNLKGRRRILQELFNFTGGSTPVPAGMDQIVSWIGTTTQSFLLAINIPNQAAQVVLNPSQASQQVLQGGAPGVAQNLLIPITFNFYTYTVPMYCLRQPTVSAYDVFCCRNTDNDNHVCYSLQNMNLFFQTNQNRLCLQAEQIVSSACNLNDIACYQDTMFTWFQNQNLQLVYGMLYFDKGTLQTLFNSCAQFYNPYPVTTDQFFQMFQKQIGELGGP